MPHREQKEYEYITSAPALAAALRETDVAEIATPLEHDFAAASLVPMYQVEAGSATDEAAHAAHMVSEIAERLRRLADAYEAWSSFDAPAYFDLSQAQTKRLVRVRERVSTVYVVFFADLLLPSFRRAEAFWATRFRPAYQAAYAGKRSADYADGAMHDDAPPANGRFEAAMDCEVRFLTEIQPQMIDYWEQLVLVIQRTRRELLDDIGFLSTNGSHEERARWHHAWQERPAPGLVPVLRPPLQKVPTLSLSFEFPLPTHRQSGRLRRLRLHRERQRRDRRRR